MIDTMTEDFDWSLCLGVRRRQQNWILSVIELARVLLGASISTVRLPEHKLRLPAWAHESVLKQWSNLYPSDHLPIQALPLMADNLRSPRALLRAIRQRWPDPITATFNLKGKVNWFPRLPYQLAAFTWQAGQFVIGLPAGKEE
jgi:hypothetical protein